MSRYLPEVSLKLGLLPVQFILIIFLLSLVVWAYYVTRFDFSVEIADVCSEFIYIYTLHSYEFSGRDGRDGREGPAGPRGLKGPKGD